MACLPDQRGDAGLRTRFQIPFGRLSVFMRSTLNSLSVCASPPRCISRITSRCGRELVRALADFETLDGWRQILEENRQPLIAVLEEFADDLRQWLAALQSDDGHKLHQLLLEGKTET